MRRRTQVEGKLVEGGEECNEMLLLIRMYDEWE